MLVHDWCFPWALSAEHCIMDGTAVGGPAHSFKVLRVTSNCI